MTTIACPVSPFFQSAAQPNKYADKSNAVFFGRLCKTENLSENIQIAEFQVLESYKGELNTRIRITNKIESDCSMAFGNAGTNYYVFGNLDDAGKEIIMDGFPRFFPEHYANKTNMLTRLDIKQVTNFDI